MTAHLQLAQRSFPDRIAELGFSAVLPADWISHELPQEEIDFSNPTFFVPLAIVAAPHAAMVFAFAARPAHDDGSLADWAPYHLKHNQLDVRAMGRETVAGVPALVGEATQPSDLGEMVVRFAFLEDGGRLINLTLTAPALLADVLREAWFAMLQSFTLETPRGASGAVGAGVADAEQGTSEIAADPTNRAATEAAASPSPLATDEELLTMALADDTASLDPEHPMNANLRDRGVGLVPRVVHIDAATQSVRIAAGALEGYFRLPFGWHVIDDGRRTLVFDEAGRIQVNLSQRAHEGRSPEDMAALLLEQYLEQQPDLVTMRHTMAGIAVSAVRGVAIGSETLDQYFLVRDVGRAGFYLVAKVSCTAEDCSRAMDLGGDIVASFETPAT